VLRPHTDATPAVTNTAVALAAASRTAEESMGRTALAKIPSPAAKPKPKPAAAPIKAVAPRPAAIVIGSTQQALINQDRARYGLRPLTWSSCLANIAYSNAVRMANALRMWHTNGASLDLGCRLGSHGGENIGYWTGGVRDAQLNTMFMNSAEHRANILSPYYHYVGTSWRVAANGTAYIAVEFS
jgi:uncharacterized protein YkwD